MNGEERKEISNEQRKKFKWDLEANLNHFMQPNFKQTFTQINSRTSLNLQSALPMSTFRLSSHWMLAQIWNFICRWHSSNTSFCYYRTVSLSYYYWLAKYVIPTEYRCGGNNSESTGFVLLLFICMCFFVVFFCCLFQAIFAPYVGEELSNDLTKSHLIYEYETRFPTVFFLFIFFNCLDPFFCYHVQSSFMSSVWVSEHTLEPVTEQADKRSERWLHIVNTISNRANKTVQLSGCNEHSRKNKNK